MSLHDVIKNLRLLSPWSVAIGSIMMFSLASCYDIGDRDNPLDPGANNYVTPKDSDEVSSSSKSIQSSSSSKKAVGSSSSKDSKSVEKSSSSKKSESSSSVNQSTSKKSSESRSSSSGNNANSSSSVSQISSGNTSSSSSKKIESSSSKTALSSSTSTLSSSSINLESVLGYCTVVIADSIGLVGSTYYICKSGKWEKASVVEYDTYKQKCLTDGSIVDGNVISLNKYVCDDGVFRAATENDVRAELGCTSYTRGEYRILSGQYSYYKCESEGWLFTTEKLNQGTMTDKRDGLVYKTVGIGSQMWLAENLKYNAEKSICMVSSNDSCAKYGKFYKWTTLMDLDDYYEEEYAIDILSYPHKGICPDNWHVPQRCEWRTLVDFVASHISEKSGEELPKHLIEGEVILHYDDGSTKIKKGLNTFGIGILPFDGSFAWYHSADEHTSYGHGTIVYGFDVSYYIYDANGFLGKGDYFPVRCVKD